ncbi:NTP transferase domain-containing protein [Nonomuraea sp. NPDC005501]|uniref:molybdenum cofactor guanylyltransferase n=1 Tax=Nonomuraea sp. NPDC005501 TaxID=3156884 RepID=UPI00339FAA7E
MSGGYDVVVLAGGEARRLGGADKPGLVVGGRTLLERVVAAVPGAGRVVVVGPERELPGVVFTREDPPGGGPVPALRAGLREVTAPRVVLLAADLPFLTPAHIATLLSAMPATPDCPAEIVGGPPAAADVHPAQARDPSLAPGAAAARPTGAPEPPDAYEGRGCAPGDGGEEAARPAGVVAVDGDGREQWLLGGWEAAPLRAALGRYGGRSLRGLLAPLVAARVALPERAWFDCDTMDDLDEARLGDTTRVPFPTTGGGATPTV